MKRQIEIFTAGCPVCEPVVQQIKNLICENCKLTIYNLTEQHEDKACMDKIKQYNIHRLPSVVVNGELLACCKNNRISKDDLIAAGIGQG
ncbi:thioredoxin family protein [Galbibacter sp. EGI 63066]|uniref:thioredoxin family protein n=1 Tax=Galbibacter sp. EGI 63066 TaxID=2993559 RepID=UPI0022496A30|nr:thioredoxin family protein [Galbibacter sp. EGI 63066]MCX2678916.1 thioredoxin family protein [Galbibacter sp. EGI 63066]